MGKSWNRHCKKAPLETTLQDRVMRDLRKLRKSWWVKINDSVTAGILDIHGGINGYSVVIELKTKSKLSHLQYYNLEKAHAAECQSFVVVPENWAEVYKFLQSLLLIAPPAIASLRKPARIPIWTLPAPRKKRT
jgi:hypothetical protein